MTGFIPWRRFPLLVALISSLGCRRQHAFEKVPLVRGQVEVATISETANLTVERIRFWSEEMKAPRFFLALVPKTVTSPAEAFILNHGWYDRPEYLLQYLKVDEVYGAMLGRGELRPAVLIVPDVRFSNFYRVTSWRYPFPNYLTLVGEEVAGQVSRRYRIPFERDRWGIGGFSFGGYLSLDIGRRYPGRFASVSVISGFVNPRWTFWPAQQPPDETLDAPGRGIHTIVAPGPIPGLFLGCGTKDRFFDGMLQLHEKLEGMGVAHVWSTGQGAHTWQYWSSVLPQMLKFHLGTVPRP